MTYNAIVLLPPILVLILAAWTRNVIASLSIGIVVAALMANNFSIVQSLKFSFFKVWDETNITGLWGNGQTEHLYTLGFLLVLGTLISLITHTGGIAAYSAILKQKLKNKKVAEMSSFFLAPLFFLDDFLSILTLGCIIKPITDKFKVPRAKLAYLLDSISSPLCTLIPASSWTAVILSQLKISGISENITSKTLIIGDPFIIYLKSIPFTIYSILVLASSWFIVKKGISYGPMSRHEIISEKTGNLFAGKHPVVSTLKECGIAGSLGNFFIPIGIFLVSLIILLFYSGYQLTPNPTLFNILLAANPFSALFWSCVLSLISSTIYLYYKKVITLETVKDIIASGYKLMLNPLIILLLAWTFAAILKDTLGTGDYLANLLINNLPGFTLPLMIFLSSMVIAASTGSSWGTIAIVLPLSIPAVTALSAGSLPLTPDQASFLYPVIGALISGSLAGVHISLISDSTIMAATSSGSYAIDHLITQLPYVAPAIIFTAIGFMINGLYNTKSWTIQFVIIGIMLALTFFTITLLNKLFKVNANSM